MDGYTNLRGQTNICFSYNTLNLQLNMQYCCGFSFWVVIAHHSIQPPISDRRLYAFLIDISTFFPSKMKLEKIKFKIFLFSSVFTLLKILKEFSPKFNTLSMHSFTPILGCFICSNLCKTANYSISADDDLLAICKQIHLKSISRKL